MIMEGDGFVKQQIDKVRDDKHVKAIVVRVDSPGGTVSGSDYIFHHLKKLRDDKALPLVVSMGGMAASGGYYVSMAVGDKARHHLCRAHLHHRLDRRDDPALRHQRPDEATSASKTTRIATHPRKLMLSMTRE